MATFNLPPVQLQQHNKPIPGKDSTLLRAKKSPRLLSCANSMLLAKSSAERTNDISFEYSTRELLSGGMTYRVQRAIRRCDGKEVALKQPFRPELMSNNALKQEFDLLREIKHPNILQVLDVFPYGSDVTLVM